MCLFSRKNDSDKKEKDDKKEPDFLDFMIFDAILGDEDDDD